MSLDQLENKIYREKGQAELEKERKENSEYNPEFSSRMDNRDSTVAEWKEPPPSFFSKNKKILLIIGIAFVFVISGAVGFVMYKKGQATFVKDDVLLSVDSSDTIISGDTVNYSIEVSNTTKVSLLDAELFITPPGDLADLKLSTINNLPVETDFSRNIKAGEIKKGEKYNITMSGRLIGAENSIHYLEVSLVFKPENVSSRFEINNRSSVTIKDTPISFSLNAPKQASSGEELVYDLVVTNNTDNSLENIEIKWELPDGFTVKQSDPLIDKNDTVKISLFGAKQSKKVTVTGNLKGNVNDVKVVKISLGQNRNNNFIKYGEDQAPTKIALSYLLITQSVNGRADYNASPGEELKYIINYKNNSEFSIGEAIVSAKLEGEIFDFKTLSVEDGSFDEHAATVTWKGAGVPGLLVLSPGEEGSIEFSVNLKSILPINDFNDRNFTVKSVAQIQSLEIPTPLNVNKIIESNETITKINSKIILSAKAYYDEPTATIVNSGPIPPKVKEETTYTVHWLISNLTNDADGVSLVSSLPSNTRWTGQTTTNNGTTLSYNERTNEISWAIGKVPANTGIISPTYEAVFQVAITPSSNQIGTFPGIINSAKISGKDNFTGASLEDSAEVLDTSIPDDIKNRNKGKVIE